MLRGEAQCWFYLGFARRLPENRPVYGIQAKGFDGTTPLPGSVDEMVDDYLTEILAVQPEGPFHLMGLSIGGTLAQAMAARLRQDGHEVALLGLLDCVPSDYLKTHTPPNPTEIRDYVEEHLTRVGGDAEHEKLLDNAVAVILNHTTIMSGFDSPTYSGDAIFFNAVPNPEGSYAELWTPHITGAIRQYDIRCAHGDMYLPGPAEEICRVINAELSGV